MFAFTTDAIAHGTVPALSLSNEFGHDRLESGDRVDALIVPVFAGESGLEVAGGPADLLGSEQQVELWKLLVSVGAQGSHGEVTTVPGAAVSPTVERIIAVGLGDADEVTDEDVREAAGIASRAVKRPVSTDADSAEGSAAPARGARVVSTLGVLGAEAALVGHALGAYSYSGSKSNAPAPAVESVEVLTHEETQGMAERASIIVSAVAMARDLVNAPANRLFPESYAALVAEAAAELGVEVEVLDEEQLEEQGFGGIIGVGRGSARPPRLLRLSYTPENAGEDTPFVALVGKGITFDTGGISLKPGANMWDMISDMGGSAAVVASILAVAQLKLGAKVTATVPLAENMPSGEATRPGDIIRHYGGITSEVLNTDAEGRLVLADAIVRACEDEPDYLIETATLTGAQLVALGERTPGIMGSIAFRDRVSAISQRVGENGWPMPLPEELGEAIKSDVADLKNISNSRWGGMSVAGHYLSNFVPKGVQWVHMDVAGPAYNTAGAYGYTPKRGTGVPVRTILATIEDIAAKASRHEGADAESGTD